MGTHPIFESDFDCLTDLLKMTLGSRISQFQVSIFDKLRFFRGLQGVRQLNKKISLLGERQSWSSLGNTDLSKLTVLYETKANRFIFNMANPYFYHILLFVGGCVLIKSYNHSTAIAEIAEKSPEIDLTKTSQQVIQIQRVAALCLLGGLTVYCLLAPSRTVRSVQIISSSSRNAVVFECGRFFGTTPTFYVFDGYEEKRIVDAYVAEWRKKNKKGMTSKKIIEEIKQDKRIGGLRFTDDGVVLLPSGLRLSGEGPYLLSILNLNLKHGLVKVTKSELRQMLERQHYLNTSQLIRDILKTIRNGQSNQGRNTLFETLCSVDFAETMMKFAIVAVFFFSFMDYAQEKSIKPDLVEHAKEELPLSPIYNLTATDEKED